jgi:hypothetical protein
LIYRRKRVLGFYDSNFRIRIAVRPAVRMDELDLLAWRENWDIVNLLTRTPERPREVIYAAGDGVHVHYIEDYVLGVDYIMLEGPRAAGTAATIRTKLDTYGLDEILAQVAAAKDRAEKVHALHVLAAAAPPEYDSAVFEAITSALRDSDPEIRFAAAIATAYTEWREFRASLTDSAMGLTR